MSKYNVTFACGHTSTVDIVGPCKDRERKLAWYAESGDCPQCYKAKMDAQRAKEAAERKEASEAAAANAKAYGLPELTGSEKQIEWALLIREEFWDMLQRKKPNSEGMLIIAAFFDANPSAHFWIENRYGLLNVFRAYAKTKIERSAANEVPETDMVETTAPAKQTHPGAVVIECPEGAVIARYVRDEDFRQIIKGFGCEWDAEKKAWSRSITLANGPQADRAAELGNRLLKAGFAVQIAGDNIRAAAVSGEFRPEQTRWVLLRTSGDYEGYLSIKFPRGDEETYQSARKLSGARWSNPNVVVPVSSADEVAEFAKMKNFAVSPAAQKAMDEYRASINVVVPGDAPEPPEDKDPSEILNSSREVLGDLKDD